MKGCELVIGLLIDPMLNSRHLTFLRVISINVVFIGILIKDFEAVALVSVG
jgi:hypothetical protein